MAYGTANVDNIQSSTVGTPVVFKDGGGTQVGTLCRAWVNFTVSGSTCTSLAAFNVSSITYSSSGVYVVNFTTALSDSNYSDVATCTQGGTGYIVTGGTRTTTTCQLKIFGVAGSAADATGVQFAAFR
jgi:hypothetical protein